MPEDLCSHRQAITNPCVAAHFGSTMPSAPPAYADPPPPAPVHGWRRKHDSNYVGYTGQEWSHDCGVIAGRCNREAVGAVLAGAIGTATAGTESNGDSVTILVGAVLRAVAGAPIGQDKDDSDRACIGHALELIPDNRRVTWTAARSVACSVTPIRGFRKDGHQHREYFAEFKSGKRKMKVAERTYRNRDRTWVVI